MLVFFPCCDSVIIVLFGTSWQQAAETLKKNAENTQKMHNINEESEALEVSSSDFSGIAFVACSYRMQLQATYAISSRLMFTIVKGLACDQCFQILIGVLVLGILALLIVNFV